MILTQDNEYAVVLDACVLVPMPLCDTLLRLAEDPAMYRPLWGKQILQEVGAALVNQLHHTEKQRDRRLQMMHEAFPEALVRLPEGFDTPLTCIPDENDRHVLATAICGHANAIVTSNIKHFPAECLKQFDILNQTPDDFLVHQFHLRPAQVLEKLDAQASAIRQGRCEVISSLRKVVPQFIALVDQWTSK
jgi:hypothetical protein